MFDGAAFFATGAEILEILEILLFAVVFDVKG